MSREFIMVMVILVCIPLVFYFLTMRAALKHAGKQNEHLQKGLDAHKCEKKQIMSQLALLNAELEKIAGEKAERDRRNYAFIIQRSILDEVQQLSGDESAEAVVTQALKLYVFTHQKKKEGLEMVFVGIKSPDKHGEGN